MLLVALERNSREILEAIRMIVSHSGKKMKTELLKTEEGNRQIDKKNVLEGLKFRPARRSGGLTEFHREARQINSRKVLLSRL